MANMARKKLTKGQQRVWNRLTGNHNRLIREQIEYMKRSGTVSPERADELMELSYTASEGEVWHRIIDSIRGHVMRDFNMTVHRPKRRKR